MQLVSLENVQRPSFGHDMLKLFDFSPNWTNLNNGSLGSVPRYVSMKSRKLTQEWNAQPDKFLRTEYNDRLTAVRQRIATMVGADRDECVFVPNVATGVNTVIRNFQWSSGDALVITNISYETILAAFEDIGRTPPFPSVSQFELNLPLSYSRIVDLWRRHLRDIKSKQGPENKIVACFDSIASGPSIILPWREMVEVCRQEKVWSIVDAAHSLGQELGVNLHQADPDFWISSCSKWMYSQRGCALLYVPKRNQHLIKTSLPTGVVHPLPGKKANSFVDQFTFPGTYDITVPLSINDALDFRAWLGGEEVINDYCHKLALSGGRRLAEILSTNVLEYAEDQAPHMVTVRLPLPSTLMPSVAIFFHMQKALFEQYNMYATHFYHNGYWWTRVSAQIYNEVSDFERLGEAWLDICSEIKDIYAPSSLQLGAR